MRVSFFGPDGSVLGVREIIAPDACAERADTAATFIAAWVGAWSVPPTIRAPVTVGVPRGEAARGLPGPTNASRAPIVTAQADSPVISAPPPLLPAAVPSPSEAPVIAERVRPSTIGVRQSRAELGVWFLGTHDGDASALGGGLFGQYGLTNHLAITALAETTRERELPVGPAVAAYRRSRLGVGASVVRQWRQLFLDAGIVPELTMLIVHGKQLAKGNTVTTWGADLDVRVRAGLFTGRVAPFLFLGGSGAVRAQHLTLEGSTDNRTLSRWSLNAGVGLAFRLGGND